MQPFHFVSSWAYTAKTLPLANENKTYTCCLIFDQAETLSDKTKANDCALGQKDEEDRGTGGGIGETGRKSEPGRTWRL